MLKRIPKSDISIRPFKAYKQWDFNQASSEIALLEAEDGNYTSNSVTTDGGLSINKNSLYGQLRAQFYNGHEDNPFVRYGDKSSDYNIQESTRDRYLSGSAKVISIPQIYVGEGIKKGSVLLIDLEKEVPVGLEINANHISGVSEGSVIATGKIVHSGKRTHVWQVDIHHEETGKLVCTGRLTVMIIAKYKKSIANIRSN